MGFRRVWVCNEGRLRACRVTASFDTFRASSNWERNSVLFWASCGMGEYVAVGAVAEGEAIQRALDAATAVGLGEDEAMSTITSGIHTGISTGTSQ